MKKVVLPKLTIILPTFNEEKRIANCLGSIFRQDYPRQKIEILIVDDSSTDKTVAIAQNFGAKIVFHHSHNCEIGRCLGLKRATGDLVLIIDADNLLPSRDWLGKFVQAFLDNPELAGVHTGWYEYEKNSSLLNRYCTLFGASKPLSFYLKKRNFLMATENKWIFPETLVKETKDYFLVRFTPKNLPTLGSQGFLGKRKILLKTIHGPFFFHMDTVYELVTSGHNLFAIMKLGIIHRQADSFWSFHQKFYRDASRFFQQSQLRRYTYETSCWQKLITVLIMLTWAVPFWDSLKGYFKKRDFAWFLHPFLCQTTLWLTFFAFLEWKLGLWRK